MDKDFEREYLGKFDIEPMPDKCPYCNCSLNFADYEKRLFHIKKCIAKPPTKKGQLLCTKNYTMRKCAGLP